MPRSFPLCLSLFLCSLSRSRLFFFFFLMIRRPPRSTLFPHPPLFRSLRKRADHRADRGAIRVGRDLPPLVPGLRSDRKSTRLNSSHQIISYAVFCLKKKKKASNSKQVNKHARTPPRLLYTPMLAGI